jgi:hypothetical protein
MEEVPRVVGFDKSGTAMPHAKLKTAASQPFHLRVVRDVSLVREEGLECFFEDVSNLRSFRATVGALVFAVRLSNLYPLKPPSIQLLGGEAVPRVLQGRTRELHFDARGRLCDADLVGTGWRTIRGVHDLLQLVCFELGSGPPLAQPWDAFLHGGTGRYCDEGGKLLAESWAVGEGLVVAVVCEAFVVKPQATAETAVFAALQQRLRETVTESCDVEATLSRALCESQFEAEWAGVSVCVVVASRTQIVTAHLGNVTCHTLQTNARRARTLTPPHDGFNAEELQRLKGLPLVKHGATVRYFDDLSLVSRCLGLRGCAFVSAEPHIATTPREAADAVLLVCTASMEGSLSAQELSCHLAPRVSGVEMASEAERISRHRGATSRAFVLVCL